MPDSVIEPPFPAYTGAEPFIFVSYSHKDTKSVFPELVEWHKRGYRIWFDEGIEPGEVWPKQIATALSRSSWFVVFISPDAVASRHVNDEIHFALDLEKPFLAIHIGRTELPLDLHMNLGRRQALHKYELSPDTYRRKLEKTFPDSLREKAAEAAHEQSTAPTPPQRGTPLASPQSQALPARPPSPPMADKSADTKRSAARGREAGGAIPGSSSGTRAWQSGKRWVLTVGSVAAVSLLAVGKIYVWDVQPAPEASAKLKQAAEPTLRPERAPAEVQPTIAPTVVPKLDPLAAIGDITAAPKIEVPTPQLPVEIVPSSPPMTPHAARPSERARGDHAEADGVKIAGGKSELGRRLSKPPPEKAESMSTHCETLLKSIQLGDQESITRYRRDCTR